MYVFSQTTGDLFQNNKWIGSGAAGQGKGLKNPAMQNVHNIGPLPQGRYKIGKPYHHPRLGPLTFDLTPDPNNEMFGRSDFRIHGFAPGCDHKNPGTSSEGCCCQEHTARQFVSDNIDSDDDLEVIE